MVKGASPERRPGRSKRTPGKHGGWNGVSGQQVGALQLPSARATIAKRKGFAPDRLVVFEMCAGDGVYGAGESFHRNTSPGISAYHAQFLSSTATALPVDVRMFETAWNSFTNLRTVLMHELPGMHELNAVRRKASPYLQVSDNGDRVEFQANRVHVSLHNRSVAVADLADIGPYTAVVVFCDPNNMGGNWPLSPDFLAAVHARTTFLTIVSTMGCNPGGIMMLPWETRRTWYDRVALQDAAAWHLHDTLVARIDGDNQKWAYAVTAPWTFHEDVQKSFENSFAAIGYALDCAWVRHDPIGAKRIQDQLFLRDSERKVSE